MLAFALGACGHAQEGAGPALVVVVRHAEKAASPADDPGLTEAGAARAQALATLLADAQIDTIVTTQYRRTRETAAPLARARGLTPHVIDAGGDAAVHAHEVADRVRRQPGGSAVLVVGHSNTVGAIIAGLGGPRVPDLEESEYDTLFVLAPGGRLVRARFGR